MNSLKKSWVSIFRLAGATVIALLFAFNAYSEPIRASIAWGKPCLTTGEKHINYIKIGLTGLKIEARKQRSPVNIAIVLDRSGSMQGGKLEAAKEAAIMAIERLNSDDIISVVAYDSTVTVLVPATKVSDKGTINEAIKSLTAGSNTALFAGVCKGAKEIRKFLDKKRPNRIILLSDGLANEGPSSTSELGDLGSSLIKEGISVTTFGLGLGYNEDLMMQLAQRSDGNHAFIEKTEELAKIFNYEFGDVLSVVAQEVQIKTHCKNFRPVRVLGRDSEIRGQSVITTMNQLYSDQEKYVLLEAEIPSGEVTGPFPSAEVEVSYHNMFNNMNEKQTYNARINFTSDKEEASGKENRDVMIAVINQLANEKYKLATKLRDEGNTEEARKTLMYNKDYLSSNADKYKAENLKKFAEQNDIDAKNLDESAWNRTRKNMRKNQHGADYQQSY